MPVADVVLSIGLLSVMSIIFVFNARNLLYFNGILEYMCALIATAASGFALVAFYRLCETLAMKFRIDMTYEMILRSAEISRMQHGCKCKNLKHEELTCAVCTSHPRSVVFMPCRHLVCCSDCSENHRLENCPVCRKKIEAKTSVYL